MWQFTRRSLWFRPLAGAHAYIAIVSAIGSLVIAPSSKAAWAFSETFNGEFQHPWSFSQGMPTELIALGTVHYLGGPADSFTTVDGAQTLRMTNTMTALSRRGLVTTEFLQGSVGIVEARFNTLTQDANHVDGLFDFWLLNHNDNTSFVRVALFGGNSSTDRRFVFATSADGEGNASFNYQSNTWYRLRIDSSGPQLVVDLLNDQGGVLINHSFPRSLSTLGNDFQIGIAQYVGTPAGLATTDVAIDSVTATPEPSASCLLVVLAMTALARRKMPSILKQ
jgi:hypothetical protein